MCVFSWNLAKETSGMLNSIMYLTAAGNVFHPLPVGEQSMSPSLEVDSVWENICSRGNLINRFRRHCHAQAIVLQSLSWSCAPRSHTCCAHAKNSELLVLLMGMQPLC